jgi:hypothetical protein
VDGCDVLVAARVIPVTVLLREPLDGDDEDDDDGFEELKVAEIAGR